jgi:hypothetical protein
MCWASVSYRNQCTWRHASRKLPLTDSLDGLAVGLPGREKLSVLGVGPTLERFAAKLPAIIDLDALRHQAQRLLQTQHYGHHIFPFQRIRHGWLSIGDYTYLSLRRVFCGRRSSYPPRNTCASPDVASLLVAALAGAQLPDYASDACCASSSHPSSTGDARASIPVLP